MSSGEESLLKTLRWRSWVMSNRFKVLLCALVLLLFVAPIFNVLRTSSPTFVSRVVVMGCFDLMLISSLFVISRSRKTLIAAVVLSIPALILQGLSVVNTHNLVRAAGLIFTILFLGYITALIIRALFRARTITSDLICASLCAYLLLGIFWASIYSLTEIFLPGSFSISDVHTGVSGALDVSGTESGFAIYYSLVTLSTLGYGDVIPANSISRVLSSGEAVVGQIYLAVLVARLVGLHISQSMMQNNNRREVDR
jgi:voltage-gated potassium channel